MFHLYAKYPFLLLTIDNIILTESLQSLSSLSWKAELVLYPNVEGYVRRETCTEPRDDAVGWPVPLAPWIWPQHGDVSMPVLTQSTTEGGDRAWIQDPPFAKPAFYLWAMPPPYLMLYKHIKYLLCPSFCQFSFFLFHKKTGRRATTENGRRSNIPRCWGNNRKREWRDSWIKRRSSNRNNGGGEGC